MEEGHQPGHLVETSGVLLLVRELEVVEEEEEEDEDAEEIMEDELEEPFDTEAI